MNGFGGKRDSVMRSYDWDIATGERRRVLDSSQHWQGGNRWSVTPSLEKVAHPHPLDLKRAVHFTGNPSGKTVRIGNKITLRGSGPTEDAADDVRGGRVLLFMLLGKPPRGPLGRLDLGCILRRLGLSQSMFHCIERVAASNPRGFERMLATALARNNFSQLGAQSERYITTHAPNAASLAALRNALHTQYGLAPRTSWHAANALLNLSSGEAPASGVICRHEAIHQFYCVGCPGKGWSCEGCKAEWWQVPCSCSDTDGGVDGGTRLPAKELLRVKEHSSLDTLTGVRSCLHARLVRFNCASCVSRGWKCASCEHVIWKATCACPPVQVDTGVQPIQVVMRLRGAGPTEVSVRTKGPTHIEPDGDGSTGTCACRACTRPVWPEDQGWCDLCFGGVGGSCTCDCEGCNAPHPHEQDTCEQRRIGCPHEILWAFTCTGGEGYGWCCTECHMEWWIVPCTCPPDDLTGNSSALSLQLRGGGPSHDPMREEGARRPGDCENSSMGGVSSRHGERVLLLFSGPTRGEDGLAAACTRFGLCPTEIDTLIAPDLDLYAGDELFEELMIAAYSGEFCALIAAPPCGTFSVARLPMRPDASAQAGPGQLRERSSSGITGLPGLGDGAADAVRVANTLVCRTVRLAIAIYRSGGVFIIENPVDRGDVTTSFFRQFWAGHASMWLMPEIVNLREVICCTLSTFAQCGMGSAFQKYTSVLYCSELGTKLHSLISSVCTHESHEAVAFGRDVDGDFKSRSSARYPRAMNLFLAEAIARIRPPGGARPLTVGSAIPHAHSTAIACIAIPTIGPVSSGSVRRLQRETADVLEAEPLPYGNMPVYTRWADPPIETRVPPAPLTTAQLIPGVLLNRLATFRDKLVRCAAAARDGRWQVARSMRPEPVYASEQECRLPAGQGWSWIRQPGTDIWFPVTPSSFPDDLPESDVLIHNVVAYARKHGFPDMQIISWMAHGIPGPAMESMHTLIGAFHVGALQHFKDYELCDAKDRLGNFGASGERLPVVWPMLADPTNLVHSRAGKPRMTVDKSIQLRDGVPSYNDAVLDDEQLRAVRVSMVKLQELGRARAILGCLERVSNTWNRDTAEAWHHHTPDPGNSRTFGECMPPFQRDLPDGSVDRSEGDMYGPGNARVRFWGFDLRGYFRTLPTNRASRWQSGTTRADGFGDDRRIQFGMREAMDTTGRVTVFNVFAIRTELTRLDRSYPPYCPTTGNSNAYDAWCKIRLRHWKKCTSEHGSGGPLPMKERQFHRWLSLFAVFMFVDDVAGCTYDDMLYRAACRIGGEREPWSRIVDVTDASPGRLVWHTRAWLHFEAAVGVMKHFGFDEAPGKSWRPDTDIIYLGMLFDGTRELIVMPEDKRVAYATTIATVRRGKRTSTGAIIAEYSVLNSLTHQLLHAASVIVLGRQHLYYVRQALHARNRMGGARCLLHDKAQVELRWWAEQLMQHRPNGVPFASRSHFPCFQSPHVMVTYSDASRELRARLTESGFGSWCVLGDTLYYIEGRWTTVEIYLFSINVLELKAMNMGLFTFCRLAASMNLEITEVCEFTDNRAAEFSADRGTARTERMVALVAERYDFLVHAEVASAVTRIATDDNDLADGLSRGGVYLADALRLAAASGLRIRAVDVPDDIRCTIELRRMLAHTPNAAA